MRQATCRWEAKEVKEARSEAATMHQGCNQIVNSAASYEQQRGREGSNCKASRSRYHASFLGPIRRTTCQLDHPHLRHFVMQASLVVGKKSRPKFSWRHMRFSCSSYPPSCPAESLLVVGVAQRTEAFGNLSGFLLNQHYPPPFVAVVCR